MTSLQRRHLLWLFLAGSLLSLGAGILVDRPQAPLDLGCGGRSAQLLPGKNRQQWLLHRYDLDLRPEGLGSLKARLHLLDAASGQDLGYRNLATHFSYRRQGQRVLLRVLSSDDGQTGDLRLQRLAGLGLYAFNPELRLTSRLRQLGPGLLLIDNGQDGVLFCAGKPPS